MKNVRRILKRRQDDFVTLAEAANYLGVTEEDVAVEIFNEERKRPIGGMYEGRFLVFAKDVEEMRPIVASGKCDDPRKRGNRLRRFHTKMESGHRQDSFFCRCGVCTKQRDQELAVEKLEEQAKFKERQAKLIERYKKEDVVVLSGLACFDGDTGKPDPFSTKEQLKIWYPARLARVIAKRVLGGDKSIHIAWY